MSAAEVAIRPCQPADAGAVYEAVSASMAQIAPWMPWCHEGYSPADAQDWIERAVAGWQDGTLYDFAIIADGCFAGVCGLNQIDALDHVANLGYWLNTAFTGRGVATAATEQLLRWAFTNTTLNRIEIVVAVDNLGSQRVAEKAGAQRDAVLAARTMVRGAPSSAVLYSMLRPGLATES